MDPVECDHSRRSALVRKAHQNLQTFGPVTFPSGRGNLRSDSHWAVWRTKTLGMDWESRMLCSVNMSPLTGGRRAPSPITANKTGESCICQILLSFGILWLQHGGVLPQTVNIGEAAAAALRDKGGAFGRPLRHRERCHLY